MSLIRRVNVPAHETVQVIPPDGEEHSGGWHWTVLNPTGAAGPVELVDAADKVAGDGRVLVAGQEWNTDARDESVFVANGGAAAVEVQVTGTLASD